MTRCHCDGRKGRRDQCCLTGSGSREDTRHPNAAPVAFTGHNAVMMICFSSLTPLGGGRHACNEASRGIVTMLSVASEARLHQKNDASSVNGSSQVCRLRRAGRQLTGYETDAVGSWWCRRPWWSLAVAKTEV